MDCVTQAARTLCCWSDVPHPLAPAEALSGQGGSAHSVSSLSASSTMAAVASSTGRLRRFQITESQGTPPSIARTEEEVHAADRRTPELASTSSLVDDTPSAPTSPPDNSPPDVKRSVSSAEGEESTSPVPEATGQDEVSPTTVVCRFPLPSVTNALNNLRANRSSYDEGSVDIQPLIQPSRQRDRARDANPTLSSSVDRGSAGPRARQSPRTIAIGGTTSAEQAGRSPSDNDLGHLPELSLPHIKDLEGIMPLEAGRTNKSYLLNCKGAKSILRVSNEETHVHVIDRKFEQAVYVEASNALLAPKVVATGKNFIITEFYENENARDAMSSIQMVMPALLAFYGLLGKKEGRAPNFEEVLQERMRRAHEGDIRLPDNYGELEDAVKEAIASPEYLALPRALCHLDLTPRNILFGAKGIRFIDFEMANWGPRLLDLSSISVGYGLDDQQDKELVGRYYDKGPQAMSAFYKTKLIYHFRCALWLLLQSKIEDNKKWRESDSKDLVVDINKAFDCIEKIGRSQDQPFTSPLH